MERIIEAGEQSGEKLGDLRAYKELFFFLVWRDLIVRYKQTAVGVAWTVIKPLLSMLALTLVFGLIARLPSHGIPYAILVLSGLLPWQLFATGFAQSSDSILANTNLVTKVYFPRIILPAVPIFVAMVDFAVSFAFLLALMIAYGVLPSWPVLLLPLFVLLTLLFALGVGLLFSAISVRYRDLKYIIPFLIQFGLYLSPVAFSSSILPEPWRLLFSLNPMVCLINGFRWSLLGEPSLLWQDLAIAIPAIIILFLVGFHRFKGAQQSFPDLI